MCPPGLPTVDGDQLMDSFLYLQSPCQWNKGLDLYPITAGELMARTVRDI